MRKTILSWRCLCKSRRRAVLRAPPALLAALALCGVSAGCGSGSDSQLTVFAASSLQESLTAYGKSFEGADVRSSFAGSDTLAAQIRQGATADVFASADTEYPAELHREGLVEKPVVFAANELVIAVPAAATSPRSPTWPSRAAKIVIGDAERAGRLLHARGARHGCRPPSGEGILANVRSEEPEVSSIVAKLGQRRRRRRLRLRHRRHGGRRRTARDPASGEPASRGGLCGRGGEGKRSAGARAALSRRAAERSRRRGSAPRRIPAAADDAPRLVRAGGVARDRRSRSPSCWSRSWRYSPTPARDGCSMRSGKRAPATRSGSACAPPSIAVAIIVVVGTPVAYLLAMRELPRPRRGADADRAAPRRAARRRRNRAAGGLRPPGHRRLARCRRRHRTGLPDGRRGGRPDLRRGSVLPAAGDLRLRRRRPTPAGGLADAGRRRLSHLPHRRRPGCPARSQLGPGARLGTGARRVRGDADVRRLACRA